MADANGMSKKPPGTRSPITGHGAMKPSDADVERMGKNSSNGLVSSGPGDKSSAPAPLWGDQFNTPARSRQATRTVADGGDLPGFMAGRSRG